MRALLHDPVYLAYLARLQTHWMSVGLAAFLFNFHVTQFNFASLPFTSGEEAGVDEEQGALRVLPGDHDYLTSFSFAHFYITSAVFHRR